MNAIQEATPRAYSRGLAAFANGLNIADIPAKVLQRAKLHILDAIGLGFASHANDYAKRSIAGVQAIGGTGDCTVLGHSGRFDVRDAALLNGVLVHGLDFDDTHLASIIHPTTTSLPAAMALGESLNVSGSELLIAFLAGAETSIRVGGAAKGGFHHVGYHATGVVSHFASAITAGRLLGLDEDGLVAAQGIAGSTASGIQVFLEEGAWTKRMHPGWGAVAGITAARLAQHGFKGPSRPYEGRFGLFDTHMHGDTDKVDFAELTADLGAAWRFGDTALKPYPVCHFIHGCADAAIMLHAQITSTGASPEDIVAVDAFLPQPTLHIIAEPEAAKRNATTDYEVKFSAHHVIAACLVKGHFNLPDLAPDEIANPRIRELAQRVTCHADPDSAFPEYFSGGVEITLRDGRRLRQHVRVNSGAGERALTTDGVVAKFMATAGLTLPPADAERVAEVVLDLERRSARDLAVALRATT